MSYFRILVPLLLLGLGEVHARSGEAIWDSRCEECHGDPEPFARKYLWNIQGQLQGQHHIDDMDLFMQNHYIPDHEIQTIHDMLLSQANSPQRYLTECGECHGDVRTFVKDTFWVGEGGITIIASGKGVSEFLQDHEDLATENLDYYEKYFTRIANLPAR